MPLLTSLRSLSDSYQNEVEITGKLFFRDQNGVIYESPDNEGVITDDGLHVPFPGVLVRSDATIRDYDYEAVINDLAGASAGNIGFVLDRLLDRDTLMPSEDAAKLFAMCRQTKIVSQNCTTCSACFLTWFPGLILQSLWILRRMEMRQLWQL